MDAFDYTGKLYIRPIGRGICFVKEDGELADELQLEDLLDEGYWEGTVSLKRIPAPDKGR